MRLVFWHPHLSIHHAPLLRRLAEMRDMQTELVARPMLENGRAAGGWSMPDYGRTLIIDSTNANPRALAEHVISQSRSHTLHLISDALFNPISRAAWQCCVRKGIAFGFISICPGMYVGRFGRLLRHAFYRLYVRRAARAVNPILTISKECSDFFLRNGFSPKRIYPWAYFVEDPPTFNEVPPSPDLRLLYLGRLIARKRVDVLLRALALARAENSAIALKIIGDGPERPPLESLPHELKISHAVEFRSSIPHERVHEELQKHDALVLPTECDDWGVVVNEALQSGLAVITTPQAGAHELLAHSAAGIVSECNPESFSAAILTLANSPQLVKTMRQHARDYAKNITPIAAAHYLRAIAHHTLYGSPRPIAPWQTRLNVETNNEIAPDRLRQCRRPMDDAHGLPAAHPATDFDAPHQAPA